MKKLAVLILTYNEEAHILECANSAKFADEIVVIDSGSTDKTVELAESIGCRVVYRSMAEGFAAQRNFALTQTAADWVMFLDADERITPELAVEVRQAVKDDKPQAYEILRHNYVFRQLLRHGGFRPDWSLRLYPRTAISWEGRVHESAKVTCPVKRLKNIMKHYTYDEWSRYFAKVNNYTSGMAEKLFEKGKPAGLINILFRPLWGFIKVYIIQCGWLDGKLGLIFSILHAYYTFVKYIKLDYLYSQSKRSI
jgi:glycosyltransferase involved in cell wall biosynthesis